MKAFINQLLKDHSIEDIENSFVQCFIKTNSLNIKNNLLLLDIINNKNSKIKEIKEKIFIEFSGLNIYELQECFELLIPEEDRKLNGAFFTPQHITGFMASELINVKSQLLCDPSCGCGAFLVASIYIFKKKFNSSIINIIENNIYGLDILDYCIRRCKIILSLLAIINNEDIKIINFNIHCADSLKTDWGQRFSSIMKKGGFDVVIGNPPYVKYQDLTDAQRKYLFNSWQTLKNGTYNLYFAFFELGINIMKKDGALAYITPNNYFTSLAGEPLREYIQNNMYAYKIIDFNHLQVFDAQTYTCITFMNKKQNKGILFDEVDNKKHLNNLQKKLEFSIIPYEKLDKKKWRMLRNIDMLNISKIENSGERLGNILNIKTGIATCKDAIYFIDGKTLKNKFYTKAYRGNEFQIEANITKPIIKISDISNANDLKDNSRRIIFPYKIINNKAYVIKEDEMKKDFPKCYKYLKNAKAELLTRDKGKKLYEAWYSYARTQGLTSYGEKILTPTFSSKPRFIYDNNCEDLFCNGYAMFLNSKKTQSLFTSEIPLNTIMKVINSNVMAYYVNKTSVAIEGGYPCYQKNFIELFTIPIFTEKEINKLEEIKDEKEIDEILFEKYRLKDISF